MTHPLDVAGFTLTIGSAIAALAVIQWLIMTIVAAASKAKMPKKGMRSTDVRLIVSTAIFVIAWVAVFSSGPARSKTNPAAIVSTKTHGTCSSISTDMAAAVVKTKLGQPDEIRSDEETRGPGAAIWVYRDSRCAVHIFDERVEFID